MKTNFYSCPNKVFQTHRFIFMGGEAPSTKSDRSTPTLEVVDIDSAIKNHLNDIRQKIQGDPLAREVEDTIKGLERKATDQTTKKLDKTSYSAYLASLRYLIDYYKEEPMKLYLVDANPHELTIPVMPQAAFSECLKRLYAKPDQEPQIFQYLAVGGRGMIKGLKRASELHVLTTQDKNEFVEIFHLLRKPGASQERPGIKTLDDRIRKAEQNKATIDLERGIANQPKQ